MSDDYFTLRDLFYEDMEYGVSGYREFNQFLDRQKNLAIVDYLEDLIIQVEEHSGKYSVDLSFLQKECERLEKEAEE